MEFSFHRDFISMIIKFSWKKNQYKKTNCIYKVEFLIRLIIGLAGKEPSKARLRQFNIKAI